jgi:hypothetical protein
MWVEDQAFDVTTTCDRLFTLSKSAQMPIFFAVVYYDKIKDPLTRACIKLTSTLVCHTCKVIAHKYIIMWKLRSYLLIIMKKKFSCHLIFFSLYRQHIFIPITPPHLLDYCGLGFCVYIMKVINCFISQSTNAFSNGCSFFIHGRELAKLMKFVQWYLYAFCMLDCSSKPY